jgi:hypothetical protein
MGIAKSPIRRVYHGDVGDHPLLSIHIEHLVLEHVGVEHEVIDVEHRLAVHAPNGILPCGVVRHVHAWFAEALLECPPETGPGRMRVQRT